MEEVIDILDEVEQRTGEVRTYSEVHAKGLRHRTVHIWFLNSNKQLLLQKRSKNKITHPGCWDISVAGHVSAGETTIEAAQKETREEIGLPLPPEAYQKLFTLKHQSVLNNGTYVNNEFQDLFIVRSDVAVSELVLPANEVEAVKWVSIDDFKKMIERGGEEIVPHQEEYTRLLEYISQTVTASG